MHLQNEREFIVLLKQIKIKLLKQAITEAKFLIIQVSGDSMLPAIHDGEEIVVKPINSINELKVDDVVFFYDFNYKLALHRLIRIEPNQLILKGDNCDQEDKVKPQQILGKTINDIHNTVFNKKLKYKIGSYILILEIKKNKLKLLKILKI